jgi:hypothetical protein
VGDDVVAGGGGVAARRRATQATPVKMWGAVEGWAKAEARARMKGMRKGGKWVSGVSGAMWVMVGCRRVEEGLEGVGFGFLRGVMVGGLVVVLVEAVVRFEADWRVRDAGAVAVSVAVAGGLVRTGVAGPVVWGLRGVEGALCRAGASAVFKY